MIVRDLVKLLTVLLGCINTMGCANRCVIKARRQTPHSLTHSSIAVPLLHHVPQPQPAHSTSCHSKVQLPMQCCHSTTSEARYVSQYGIAAIQYITTMLLMQTQLDLHPHRGANQYHHPNQPSQHDTLKLRTSSHFHTVRGPGPGTHDPPLRHTIQYRLYVQVH